MSERGSMAIVDWLRRSYGMLAAESSDLSTISCHALYMFMYTSCTCSCYPYKICSIIINISKTTMSNSCTFPQLTCTLSHNLPCTLSHNLPSQLTVLYLTTYLHNLPVLYLTTSYRVLQNLCNSELCSNFHNSMHNPFVLASPHNYMECSCKHSVSHFVLYSHFLTTS